MIVDAHWIVRRFAVQQSQVFMRAWEKFLNCSCATWPWVTLNNFDRPYAFSNNRTGSSQAAQMLFRQRQQQCGAVSFRDMEILVAALASSILSSSAARESAGSNVVDVEKMSQLCALVDDVTIIGSSQDFEAIAKLRLF